MAFISVIVPVYNVEKYLKKCIDSIIAQDFNDYEIIIVNDGSTDNSLQIAQELKQLYPDKINLISQENQGPGMSRNVGIKHSKGEYLLFIDSDDSIKPETLKTLSKQVENDVDICMFDAQLVSENYEVMEYLKGCKSDNPKCLKEYPQLLFDYPSVWNKLFKKSLFVDNQIEFPSKVWYEDLRTIFKVYTKANKIVYIDQPFYNYVFRKGSIMNSSKLSKNLEIIQAVDDIINYFVENNLYETYKDELEYMAFCHQLIVTTTRVNQIDKKSDIQKRLKDDYIKKFPNYKNNKYVKNSSIKEKIVLFLINHNMYSLMNFIMSINKNFKGKNV